MRNAKTTHVNGWISRDWQVLWKAFLFWSVPNILLIKFIQFHPFIYSFSTSFLTCKEKSAICKILKISYFLEKLTKRKQKSCLKKLDIHFFAVFPFPWLFKNIKILIPDLRSNYKENGGLIFIFGNFEIPRCEKNRGLWKKKLISQDNYF